MGNLNKVKLNVNVPVETKRARQTIRHRDSEFILKKVDATKMINLTVDK